MSVKVWLTWQDGTGMGLHNSGRLHVRVGRQSRLSARRLAAHRKAANSDSDGFVNYCLEKGAGWERWNGNSFIAQLQVLQGVCISARCILRICIFLRVWGSGLQLFGNGGGRWMLSSSMVVGVWHGTTAGWLSMGPNMQHLQFLPARLPHVDPGTRRMIFSDRVA
jgi:hypothetical protein